jgi:hypothetical protein
MSNSDIQSLKKIARAIAKSGLTVNGDISGDQDDYELITYIDEVVVLDSLGQEVVSEPRLNDDD